MPRPIHLLPILVLVTPPPTRAAVPRPDPPGRPAIQACQRAAGVRAGGPVSIDLLVVLGGQVGGPGSGSDRDEL